MKRDNVFDNSDDEETRLIEESRRRRSQIKLKHSILSSENVPTPIKPIIEEVVVIEIIPTPTEVVIDVMEDDMFADELPDSTKHVNIVFFGLNEDPRSSPNNPYVGPSRSC